MPHGKPTDRYNFSIPDGSNIQLHNIPQRSRPGEIYAIHNDEKEILAFKGQLHPCDLNHLTNTLEVKSQKMSLSLVLPHIITICKADCADCAAQRFSTVHH